MQSHEKNQKIGTDLLAKSVLINIAKQSIFSMNNDSQRLSDYSQKYRFFVAFPSFY